MQEASNKDNVEARVATWGWLKKQDKSAVLNPQRYIRNKPVFCLL